MIRTGWKLFFSLTLLLLALVLSVQAQNATYHLHKEASATTGLFQLKTAWPDGTSLAVQSANLKGLAAGEHLIKNPAQVFWDVSQATLDNGFYIRQQ